LLRNIPLARKRGDGGGYQDVANLPEDVVRAWVQPLIGTAESARQYQRMFASLHTRDLLAIEPALTRLQVPTLIVWGTADINFRRKWAYWLRDHPRRHRRRRDRRWTLVLPRRAATELTAALRRHWDAHLEER
jgi:pimeloyl-ACP methyl ester carboxylesterase